MKGYYRSTRNDPSHCRGGIPPEPIFDPPAPAGSRATDLAMTNNTDIVFPPAARHAQAERGSSRAYEKRIAAGFPDRVTPDLAAFVAQLDTAFLATVSAAVLDIGRAGPKGFIKVLDEKTLGFADYAGNRQY